MTKPILAIESLNVSFKTRTGVIEAVKDVSFSVGRNKLGIVGESGSGKTVTGRAILGLLPASATVSAKKLEFHNTDLLQGKKKKFQDIRGKKITMVMQDPRFSLNPVMKVGQQIAENYRLHNRLSRKQAKEKAIAMMESVRIHSPDHLYHAYPHEVSGGIGQRIMLAMMLAPDPEILIADEITSALDVTVQLQILAILDDLVTQNGMGLIFISHDLTLVSSFCDEVVVMYMGRVMEICQASELEKAKHPYTRGLLNCLPKTGHKQEKLPVLQRDEAWLK